MKYINITILIISSLVYASAYGTDKEPIVFTGITYPDPDTTIFLKSVLKAMEISFSEKATPEGMHISWQSKSDTQFQEIQNRVSQYVFVKDACKNIPLPTPEAPAQSKLSC